MKKSLLTVLIISLMVMMFPVMGLAEEADDNTYYVEELGLTLEFPESVAYAGLDVEEGNAILECMDMTAEEYTELLETYNEYLLAWDFDNEFNMDLLLVEEFGFSELTGRSDAFLDAGIDYFTEELEAAGYTVEAIELFDQGKVTFYKVLVSASDAYQLHYLTYHGYDLYNFNFNFLGEEITDEQIEEMDQIMASARFDGSDETCYIADMGLEILPYPGYEIITRENMEDSTLLKELGVDADYMLSYFEANNIYLNSLADDLMSEMVVVKSVTTYKENLEDMDEDEQEVFIDLTKEEFDDAGVTVENLEIYENAQHTFTFTDFYMEQSGTLVYGIQYYTVHGGKGISVTFRSYNGPITDEQRELMEKVAESIRLSDVSEAEETEVDEDDEDEEAEESDEDEAEVEEASESRFVDFAVGAEFVVPENLDQIDFEEFSSATAVFADADGVPRLVYVSIDLYADDNGDIENRKDYNNEAVDISVIAYDCNVDEDEVTMETIGDKEFYVTEDEGTITVDGKEIEIIGRGYILIEGGFYYKFAVIGDDAAEFFEEFIQSAVFADGKN